MPICSKCKTSQEIQEGLWKDVPFEKVPCRNCELREDSYGTFPYRESDAANSSWDTNRDDEETCRPEVADIQSPLPFAQLHSEDPDDPRVPISALVSVMSLWLSLSLPARRVIQLRMGGNLPYSEIGRRLGVTRQAAEKLVAQVLAKEPLLGNLLPAKTARAATPLLPTRTSVIGERSRCLRKRNDATKRRTKEVA